MSYVHSSSQRAEDYLFHLESIQSVPPPTGCEGAWSRYIIRQGSNTIVGTRAGPTDDVSGVIAQYVEQLNQRVAKHRAKTSR